jgi:crotonobetainyl-CoA:carnitine CoA-transferase CaiB-like acyl-CoA transferase
VLPRAWPMAMAPPLRFQARRCGVATRRSCACRYDRVPYETGAQLALVSAPVQFDEEVSQLSPGPAHAEHTDEVLGELGLSTERLLELKLAGAIS